ncbi:MAG: HAMP domain-containing protein [Kofleriaceae bacterium]|jgi:signal transduction histidine kinase|nr:HAMP domain-containing protein [Kofleriaceae bacterium]
MADSTGTSASGQASAGPAGGSSGRDPERAVAPARKDTTDGRRPVPFKRRLAGPAIVLTAIELAAVAWPVWNLFSIGSLSSSLLVRAVLPVALVAVATWWFALGYWLAPIRAAVALRRAGQKVPRELSERAYYRSQRVPLRAVALRTGLWVVGGAVVGVAAWQHAGWSWGRVIEIAAVCGLHAFVIAAVRGVWLGRILSTLRQRLFSVSPPLRRFADGYFRRLILVAAAVWGGILAAQAAVLYYFVPVSHGQYLQLMTFEAAGALTGLLAWCGLAYVQTGALRRYLRAAQEDDAGPGPSAADIYRLAQALPYRLAWMGTAIWILHTVAGYLIARFRLGLASDDSAITSTTTLVVSVAGAIYASLWHREILRPMLAHLAQRYRVPVRGIAPTLSLRSKLLLAFGGVVLLACGMAMVWGFLQYKNQATESVGRQADLGLAWLRSELQAEVASLPSEPTASDIDQAMRRLDGRGPQVNAVLYYLAPGASQPTAVGGGPEGAPRLPWYVVEQVRGSYAGLLGLGGAELAGRAGRIELSWHGRRFELGAIAVFYPNYLGRGQSLVRPLRELLLFFVILFGACAGIVAATVGQFVTPIRTLERRADGMARGELAEPVASSGEGDEIGRLTFALEEMRRALRDRLRSTEEVNLDLERAVQMRTADLARKNRELAETLDKLTTAQAQLVRSEKLASIGQLVAGIAHEINNPVNAIVNTVGPLEEALTELEGGGGGDPAQRAEAARDIRDMVRVVQRGASRTKAIVSALHNYSRTDDEHVVDFDVDRSLDDSLELLRHVLKQNIAVERRYGEVGRIRAHAGQIGQVFLNLLTNAAQALAGRDEAQIVIATEVVGDTVVIRIRDNGPGIPPSVLPRIFDPFFTTKDVGEGTGLGLSIVHELVARHGGSIEVDTQVGVGTTFIITLPRRAVDRPAAAPAPAPSGPARTA